MEQSIEVLKAIAENTRFSIVQLLLQHDFCVSAIASRLDLSEAAISQHIKILKDAGLLYGEKRGYFMHYYVDKTKLEKLITQLDSLLILQRKPCQLEINKCQNSKKKRCLIKTAKFDNNHKCSNRNVKGRIKKDGSCR